MSPSSAALPQLDTSQVPFNLIQHAIKINVNEGI